MTGQNNNLQRNKERKRFIPIQHTLSHGCSMDVILEYRNNHKIS